MNYISSWVGRKKKHVQLMQAYFKEREKPTSNDENKKKITKEKK